MIATTNMGSKLWVGQILVGLVLYGRATPQTLGHNSSNANFKYSNFEPIKSALARVNFSYCYKGRTKDNLILFS